MSIKLSKQLKRPPSLTRSNILWVSGAALGLSVAISLVAALATGTLKFGIGAGTITATSEKTDSQGKVIDRTKTTTPQDAKTLWDWLSLLVVPASLAGLGALLQLKEQRRAEQQADLEREIADKNRQQDLKIAQGTREEEALQHYLDRVSNLVIEKNLLAIAAKDAPTTEETELLDASVAVIRILTLSTLRRLSDGVRKASVVRILIDTDILGLKVILEGADLRSALLVNACLAGVILKGADLEGADLEGANLKCANLEGAILIKANLEGAKLREAKLTDANLSGAYLNSADLITADLDFTYLIKADLIGADLSGANLEGADLEGAKLYKANLEGAYLEGADLSFAELYECNLSRADLREVNLKGSQLSFANLESACLNSANLEGADLRGAKGLTGEQLEKTWICQTKLPESIGVDSNRDCEKVHNLWNPIKL